MSTHFVLVTDSHLFPDAPHDFGPPKLLTRSRGIHDVAIPQINDVHPEFVLHGGDFVCGGDAFEMATNAYEAAVREAADRFENLQAPLYLVPGNHDCDAVTGSFKAFRSSFRSPLDLDVVDVAPRLKVALVNVYPGNPMEQVNGTWTDTHDRALREASEAALADGSAILMLLHTWALPNRRDEDGTPRGAIVGADRLLKTIDECPAVVAVFCGHRHKNRITSVRDYLVVDTGALVGFPMGFREIWLEDNGLFRTRFHTLADPGLVQASYEKCSEAENDVSEGREWDRNAEIVIPRLRDLWS